MATPNQPSDPSSPTLGPDFEAWAARHLRSTFPGQTAPLPDGVLLPLLRSWIARAARYGLLTGEQVLCFSAAAFLLGAQFDSDPNHTWATGILLDADLSADERAAMLVAIAELLLEDQDLAENDRAQPR